ncbi:MAG TPA: glycosyltransferase [Terracidiphilus sp.]|nr:glycosyltransferase [Terracidiphilus sp.]
MTNLTVGQSVTCWLPQTENWLYDQVSLLPDEIVSHVFCEIVSNLDQFPLPEGHLHSFEQVRGLRRSWDDVLRKMRLRRYHGYAESICRMTGVEVLHSHFGNTGWVDRKLARKLGVRHVTTFYGLDVNHLPTVDPSWKTRYLDLFASVDRILCEGPHMAGCITALGCPEEKVQVHHLGVRVQEIAYRPRLWKRAEPLSVLIASTFREKKGIPDAIDALGVLNREIAVDLTLVGDATHEENSQNEKRWIFEALDRNGLRSRTRLPGYLSYAELMREAYSHHVFMASSVTADDGDTEGGAPVSILHMAASGMPIVATRHCDIPNLLPEDTRLAAEHDVEGLVSELRRLVNSAGYWEAELAKARQHIEENFNARIQGQRLAQIYAQVVSNRTGSPTRAASSIAQVKK